MKIPFFFALSGRIRFKRRSEGELMSLSHRVRSIRTTALAMCLGCALPQLLRADVVMLYDVDFGSPPHSVGQPPVVGAEPVPRDRPTALSFAPPTVESSVGAMDDQPMQLRVLSGMLSQAEFDLGAQTDIPTGFDLYRVDYDAMVVSLDSRLDSLTMLLDMPIVRNVYLTGGQTIRYFVSGPGGGGGIIGTYSFGVPVHIRVDLHVPTERWSISVDGRRLHTGPCPIDGTIRRVRLSLDDNAPPLTNLAAVDNVQIIGVHHAACPGDLDFDQAVTLPDLALLLTHFGSSDAWLDDGDTDLDGDVDLQDLAGMLADFGQICP
jgi:hypothetical protein